MRESLAAYKTSEGLRLSFPEAGTKETSEPVSIKKGKPDTWSRIWIRFETELKAIVSVRPGKVSFPIYAAVLIKNKVPYNIQPNPRICNDRLEVEFEILAPMALTWVKELT